jgi:Spy/CpxP family protein refolding chaperone
MGDTMNETVKTESSDVYLRKIYRWRMAFFSLVILLAGLVIGSASTVIVLRSRFGQPGGGGMGQFAGGRMLERLERELDLSPEQREELEPIVQKYMQELHEIRRNAGRTIDEKLQLMNEEISSVLDEDQQRRWQHHLERLRERLPGRGRRRGPGPGRHRQPPRFEQEGRPEVPPPSGMEPPL